MESNSDNVIMLFMIVFSFHIAPSLCLLIIKDSKNFDEWISMPLFPFFMLMYEIFKRIIKKIN